MAWVGRTMEWQRVSSEGIGVWVAERVMGDEFLAVATETETGGEETREHAGALEDHRGGVATGRRERKRRVDMQRFLRGRGHGGGEDTLSITQRRGYFLPTKPL